MTPQEFYSQYLPYAEKVSNQTGLDPRLVLAQAALETGYGKSAPNMNFFGIKSHGRKNGQTLQTSEFEDGQMVNRPASFRGYESPDQSFQDYASFLKSNPRYEGVLSARGLENQISAMAKSGYATDPNYGAKLANIAGKFDPNSPPIIASDTMRVLGKQPKGLLAVPEETNDTESKMIPEEKPKGLLGSLGIQKMVEGAEGEAGQRFFQRDTFKDTAARMAPLLAAMGSSPALQKATAGIAAQRTEKNARNKSMEYLAGLPNGEEFVRIAEVAGPKAAMQAYLESRKAPKDTSTSAMKNYSEYQRILAEEGPEAANQFLSTIKSGTTINTGDRGANEFIKAQMKKQADQYSAYSEGAMAAQDALGNLSIMEQLASQPGFYSGTLADRVVQVKKAAVAMGADPDLVKNEESFNAIAKKTALDVMGGSLGVGFSNADRDFVTSMVPGLENTQAGNAEIIGIQRKLQQRRIDLAVLSDQYSTENGNLTGFTKFIKEWAEENPLFPKAQSKALSDGSKQRVWDQSLNNGSGGFR